MHDKDNNCATYYAVSEDSYEAAEFLINKSKCFTIIATVGWYVNTKNENGNTCLHQAMMRDNIDMILLLLKSGADWEIFNNFGETPIFYASKRVLTKFNLQNKKAFIQKNLRELPNKEKKLNHKRILINLHPKRNE